MVKQSNDLQMDYLAMNIKLWKDKYLNIQITHITFNAESNDIISELNSSWTAN